MTDKLYCRSNWRHSAVNQRITPPDNMATPTINQQHISNIHALSILCSHGTCSEAGQLVRRLSSSPNFYMHPALQTQWGVFLQQLNINACECSSNVAPDLDCVSTVAELNDFTLFRCTVTVINDVTARHTVLFFYNSTIHYKLLVNSQFNTKFSNSDPLFSQTAIL